MQEAITFIIQSIFLIMCLIILTMGIVGYRRLKTSPPLLIGIAFGLLAIYNLLNILGWGKVLWWLVVLFVFVAYIIVMVALYNLMDKKKNKNKNKM